MMDELQAQIHEHAWPRSPMASADLSTSQAAADPGGSRSRPPSLTPATVQQRSSQKARRLTMSSAADAVPERKEGESTTDFFHHARQFQAQCALETLCKTNVGMNSMNSMVSPAQSPQTSPVKSPGPKYVTTRSLMYCTDVP
eukprot:468419-Rhodomonas_salina.1